MSEPVSINAQVVEAEAETFPPLLDDHGRVQDMDDAVELELGCLPSLQLREAVKYCQAKLLPLYDAADQSALRHQKRHQRITVFAALTGAFAVLFAIMQLTPLASWLSSSMLASGEAVAALFAIAAVIYGLRAAFHTKWLVERHKAERYRLLKFCALFDPKLLKASGTDITDWRNWLDGELAVIKGLNDKLMEEWLKRDPVIAVPDKWRSAPVTSDFLISLIN
jgi:hypothetical protein